MGFPQISTGGLYSTFGDPTVFTTRDNDHFELFENVTHRSRRAPAEVRRLLLPPAAAPRTARQRARRLHLYRPVQRQCVCRLPARLPDVGGVGHRPRRRERPHQLVPPLCAGRLAGPRQPDLQPRPALRVQPAHVRRGQPAVVDRPLGARRPLRDRQRRRTAHRPERGRPAAADSDSLRDVGGGRVGPRPARSQRGAAGAADRVRLGARRLPAR